MNGQNQHPNQPGRPGDPNDSAWESAMSRDFDARVRDLHEAPLSLDSVKGKAMTIQRNRRIAVAGGVLAVAAVVTPVALIAADNAGSAPEPGPAGQSSENPTGPTDPTVTVTDPATGDPGDIGLDYLLDGTWHRADGSEVTLPDDSYYGGVIWNDQLVVTRVSSEVYATTDVIDGDGTVVDSFETTGTVAVNEAGTTIAYVDDQGVLQTRWDGGQVAMADGLQSNDTVAAVVGGPDCNEAVDGCVVYTNNGAGPAASYDSHGVNDSVIEENQKVSDATEAGAVTVISTIEDDHTCGGLYDVVDNGFRWEGCDFQAQQIAPDGEHVAGLPSYYDGLGPRAIAVLDAEDGTATAEFPAEGDMGYLSQWAWADSDHLAFVVYDAAGWRIMSLTPDGTLTEVVGAVPGNEMETPFVLIQH